jgi:hypothetical protein
MKKIIIITVFLTSSCLFSQEKTSVKQTLRKDNVIEISQLDLIKKEKKNNLETTLKDSTSKSVERNAIIQEEKSNIKISQTQKK